MSDAPRTGRPKHYDTRLIVNVSDALDRAIDARVKRLNEEAERDGKVDRYDRSSVVRACLARCLAAELRSPKPAAKPQP